MIQYELDWNLDPEKDNAGEVNVDDDNNPIVPSAASADMSTPGPSELLEIAGVRRSTRGPYRKSNATNPTTQKGVLESIDAEGRLPGSKDGLGAFPPGSDLAKTMLDLKLKGTVHNLSGINNFSDFVFRKAIQDEERENAYRKGGASISFRCKSRLL